MTKKNWMIIIALFLACVLIAVFALVSNKGSEFGGADGAAEDAISTVDPDYVPWVDSLLTLPGGETESLLFCLQAALGAGVFGYGIGYFVGRRKNKKEA